MDSFKIEFSVHDVGMYGTVRDLISAAQSQHPGCRIWAEGERILAKSDSRNLPDSVSREFRAGIVMKSSKYVS